MKKLLLWGGLALALLFVALVVRAAVHVPEQSTAIEPIDIPLESEVIAQHLAQAVRFPTVSHQDPAKFDPVAFNGFVEWVKSTYPEVMAADVGR